MLKRLWRYCNQWLLLDLVKGLLLTGRYLMRRKVTLNYPQERTPVSPRFRGVHALRRYPDGAERCIACKLCEAVCPALAINIVSVEGDDGLRRTQSYDIDLFKCVYCGLCEEACPVDAVVLTDQHNYHFEHRGEQILTKEMLLAIGDKYEQHLSKKVLTSGE